MPRETRAELMSFVKSSSIRVRMCLSECMREPMLTLGVVQAMLCMLAGFDMVRSSSSRV